MAFGIGVTNVSLKIAQRVTSARSARSVILKCSAVSLLETVDSLTLGEGPKWQVTSASQDSPL